MPVLSIGAQLQPAVDKTELQHISIIIVMFSPADLSKCVCTQDFKEYAKRRLPRAVFEYIDSGSEDEKTLRQNETSFHKLMIIPRVLVSSEQVELGSHLWGKNFDLPFGFAPYAMNSICHPEGQLIPARVARQSNIIWTLSSLSTRSFAELQQANQAGVRFLQLYITKDWELTKTIVKLADKYGFTGLCVTVDAQVLGVRKRQAKTEFDSSYLPFPLLEEIHENCPTKSIHSTQRRSLLANRDLSMTWETIRRIRELTSLKVVLKGIMHPRDAEIAVNYCDAIYVSNHGGRQLDGIQSTINVLPFIKNAVGNKLPIFIDGGVRTGNDIFKCLALGANYVFVGRPLAYSMVFGQEGVKKLVDILAEELRRCMILVGCKTLADIRADSIVPQPSL